ncbi:glycosyl transferase [Enterovibrio norvegicus FF-454]|uniref:Glycosyl transferase n=1 Tax=Enterovibrio norvegicus FF-454 TaxID=1185651 RepID=A0A1E5C0I8_9GAMM|nr:M66 family metalloprotease [Enterovibrio norvegicus]OEE58990.1 glycosyl transferase [Enterovibrio norvegicus FF-454]
MKLKLLPLLIGSALVSLPTLAETNTLTAMGEQTRASLEQMQQLALDPANIVERDGRRFLQYQGKEYWVNHENYPMFPLSDKNGEYSTAFPFVDTDWEYVAYNGGFYLMHREFGVMTSDDTGCYVEYIPAARGSQHDDGSYIWQSDMVLRTVTSDCGTLTLPEITELQAASVSDIGVELAWVATSDDADYSIALTARPEGQSPITYNYSAKGKSFYIGDLEPETTYDVELKGCNALSCDTETFSFTTLPTRLSYNDSRNAQNHLLGNLRAHVNFAQTHTSVMPNGNEVLGHPNLVMSRNAQLLVTPSQPGINQMWVDVELEGVSMGRFPMLPPSALAKTDQPDNGRSDVVFSHHAWSFPLSWEWMKPGLSLRFSDNRGRGGDLNSDMLVFGGAPEMVIQNIDIGMLVEPRDRYDMIKQMPNLATDYFQKIPVSKLVMADYTPVHLRKVTLPNGKVYTKASEFETPGWHGGDMREFIGKRLFSIGINNANFGITDTAGGDASWARPFSHITAHNSRGRYLAKNAETGVVTSTVVVHGGSGGGGIVTLDDTRGNEWSHELGHNFGRGHHPQNSSIHDMESGWGWDARYNRFIGNIHWSAAPETMENPSSGEIVPPFAGEFRFLREAMGGGEYPLTGLISHYTLEHPIQSRITQDWFNRSNNLDMNSTTGFSQWDHYAQQYVEADSNYSKPTSKGVPVITVLGIYDPSENNPSQIYPLVYSNYGNLFDLPAPSAIDLQLEGWQDVVSITSADRVNTQWQTIKENNEWLPLCQFSYTNANGEQANFVGYEDTANAVCRSSSDMYWAVNGEREMPESVPMEYQLLASKGELLGKVTYSPTAALGEQTLCSLDKSGTSHDGAGFLANGKCTQFDGVKHVNGANWAYAAHQGGIMQYSLTSQKQCELVVDGENGSVQRIALAGGRYNSGESNKFHINLPADVHPERISLSCSTGVDSYSVLDSVETPRNPAVHDLIGPVIIGQEHGYEALDSALPSGWFSHTDTFDPAALTEKERQNLATLRLGNDYPNICRFPMTVNGVEKTLHGYVDNLGNGDFQCTGGSEITLRDAEGERPVLSALNQFEWLSLISREDIGERIKATENGDASLCSLNRGGDFYGAGFVNSGGQCVQEPEVYWSNGNHWTFSNGHGAYSFR